MFNYFNGFYRKIKNTLFKDKIRKSYTELLALLRRTTPLTHADIYKIQTIMFELHGEPTLVRRKFRALKDAIEYKKLMKDKAIFENDVSYGVNGSIVKGHINSEEEEEYIKNIAPAIKLSENEHNKELKVVEESTIHNPSENIKKCEKHCIDCYKAQVRNEIKQEIDMENRAKTEEKNRRVRKAKIRNINRFNSYNERLGLPRVLGMSIADEYFNVNDLDSEDKEAYEAWTNAKRIKTVNATSKQNETLENAIEDKTSKNDINLFNNNNINDNNNITDNIFNNKIFNSNITTDNGIKEEVKNPFVIKNNENNSLTTTKVLVEDDKKDSNIFKTELIKSTDVIDDTEAKNDNTLNNTNKDNVFNTNKNSNFTNIDKNNNFTNLDKNNFENKEEEEKSINLFNTQNIVDGSEKGLKIEANPFSNDIQSQNKLDDTKSMGFGKNDILNKNNEIKNIFGNNQSNFSSINPFQNDSKSTDNFLTNNNNLFGNTNINANTNVFNSNNLFNNTDNTIFNSKSDVSNPFDISKMPDNSDNIPQFNPFANTANNPFSNAQSSWENKNKSEETETTGGFRRRRARRR